MDLRSLPPYLLVGFDRRQAASGAPFLPELPVFVSDRIHHDRRIAKDGGAIPPAYSIGDGGWCCDALVSIGQFGSLGNIA